MPCKQAICHSHCNISHFRLPTPKNKKSTISGAHKIQIIIGDIRMQILHAFTSGKKQKTAPFAPYNSVCCALAIVYNVITSLTQFYVNCVRIFFFFRKIGFFLLSFYRFHELGSCLQVRCADVALSLSLIQLRFRIFHQFYCFFSIYIYLDFSLKNTHFLRFFSLLNGLSIVVQT